MGLLISSAQAVSLFIKRERVPDILTHFINISYLKAMLLDTHQALLLDAHTRTHTHAEAHAFTRAHINIPMGVSAHTQTLFTPGKL